MNADGSVPWALHLATLASRRRFNTRLAENSTPNELVADTLPHADDLIDEVEQATRNVETDDRHRTEALQVLAKVTESAISKIRKSATTQLNDDELLAFEAIVRADGTRPSLIFQQGVVPETAKFIGQWKESIVAAQSRISEIARATGRIQPANGGPRNYFGTGFLIDRDRGLVLTNRHVVEQIYNRNSVSMDRSSRGPGVQRFRVFDGLTVDFDGEAERDENRCPATVTELRILEKTAATPFAAMDLAVLRVEFEEESFAPPNAIKLAHNNVFETAAGVHSICLVGFPGRPRTDVASPIDWGWVDQELFGETYGIKRLAPGLVHISAGAFVGDASKWVFGHDASTLGGSSGSPACAWLDGGRSFGIHFSGVHADTNRAHGFSTNAAQRVIAALIG